MIARLGNGKKTSTKSCSSWRGKKAETSLSSELIVRNRILFLRLISLLKEMTTWGHPRLKTIRYLKTYMFSSLMWQSINTWCWKTTWFSISTLKLSTKTCGLTSKLGTDAIILFCGSSRKMARAESYTLSSILRKFFKRSFKQSRKLPLQANTRLGKE